MLFLALAVAAANVLPDFEFKALKAREAVDAATYRTCVSKPADTMMCWDDRGKVAGVDAVTILRLYNGTLAGVYVSVARSNYDILLDALGKKYGKPCRTSIEDWQSKGGVKVISSRVSWCFLTGDLTLREFGPDLDHSTATYRDRVNVPPETRPVVDF